MLTKVDGETLDELEGVPFKLYRELADQTATEFGAEITYGGAQIKTDVPVEFATGSDGTASMTLLPGEIYYLEETDAPYGFRLPDGMIKLSVAADGTVTAEAPDNTMGEVSQTGMSVSFTVKNYRMLVAPTGAVFNDLPFLLLLGAGALLAVLGGLERKRRRRAVFAEGGDAD